MMINNNSNNLPNMFDNINYPSESEYLPIYNVASKTIWTLEEDELLKKVVDEHGPRGWSEIANLIQGRSAKQCHNRWHDCLNPNLKKGNWSSEEDKLILTMHSKIGNKWTRIASSLKNRAAIDVKNRFNSLKSIFKRSMDSRDQAKNIQLDRNVSSGKGFNINDKNGTNTNQVPEFKIASCDYLSQSSSDSSGGNQKQEFMNVDSSKSLLSQSVPASNPFKRTRMVNSNFPQTYNHSDYRSNYSNHNNIMPIHVYPSSTPSYFAVPNSQPRSNPSNIFPPLLPYCDRSQVEPYLPQIKAETAKNSTTTSVTGYSHTPYQNMADNESIFHNEDNDAISQIYKNFDELANNA